MKTMSKVKTEELAGAALLWAIDSIEGTPPPLPGQMQLPFDLQIDPAAVDRLIAKYNVWVEPGWSYKWLANAREDRCGCGRMPGETREDAVLRAIIDVQLGNVVSVPSDLI
ncbi:hypothetical protein [Pseudomonas helleri]|uniref:DUF2591 domain-containing protein n=1 Tax=Pseudomonas helleri TaxID=1608996 RepID=A0A6L5HR62_9PSED|nr:hypothetical protein [Pseudomonas helleri]MQU04841.1 hypothetical protein [Pseudomonas helleri]